MTTAASCSKRSPTDWRKHWPSTCTNGCGANYGAMPQRNGSTAARFDSRRVSGDRPAPGYPACPEHTEKATLWRLLDPESNAGIRLTESFAMFPTAAVSGFYFSHPAAHYFGVGQIDRDQVASYAQRKGWTLAQAERWLAPNLGYDPDRGEAAEAAGSERTRLHARGGAQECLAAFKYGFAAGGSAARDSHSRRRNDGRP